MSGWIILDKPKGMKSTEAVSKIKDLFNAQKAGHAGTLDPLASGALPIALGEATKTVPYVMEGVKTYYFRIAWGEERTTDDLEGIVTKTSLKRPIKNDILALLPKYTGTILQVPPQFSAIKIAGDRAYNLAREGEIIKIPPRQVTINTLQLIEMVDEQSSVFKITCGKGTYVRSLARDMGRDLGCYGHIADLRRIAVFPFNENDLLTWDKIKTSLTYENITNQDDTSFKKDFSALNRLLIKTSAALRCLFHCALDTTQAQRIKRGQPVLLHDQNVPTNENDICVTYESQLLAIGTIKESYFKPKRLFTNT
ncbi:tRNA pseudouridine(55) synthase TruB [Bartonella ancashensis]|uniref:tRNA pseudouridine(55) synthase TruB n=1 Tax=Bartonella ancashensis TaxID=1318743 RepID=UPI0006B5D49E|nr:tRNA pseudouridine(55) synthase TruB [Bartonella ancashensis]